MPFDIEMTGTRDYQRMLKMAIAGFPGTGKTLFSSTAPEPFFVFFREQPRMMSIANRYIPHTKVVNKYDGDGRLQTPVWETFLEVLDYLGSKRGEVYRSVVVDTGDELFQSMKEGKKAQNRGKWAIQDWGWIADMYREVVNATIDLPKHVIFTYHLKNTQEGEDGEIVREIALQGAAKDEVAGWFDIVGVIDSWEEDTEKGKVVHRGILTATTPKYPFVKDHSGNLPKVFELSEGFVGDFKEIEAIVYAEENIPKSEAEVLEHVEGGSSQPVSEAPVTEIPKPEDVEVKKAAKAKSKKKEEPKNEDAPEAEAEVAPDDAGDAPEDGGPAGDAGEGSGEAAGPTEDGPDQEEDGDPDSAQADESGGGETESGEEDEEDPDAEESGDSEADGPDLEEAEANVRANLDKDVQVVGGTCQYQHEDGSMCGALLVKDKVDVNGNKMADENGEIIQVPDQDLIDLTTIRYRKLLCRPHFTELRKG